MWREYLLQASRSGTAGLRLASEEYRLGFDWPRRLPIWRADVFPQYFKKGLTFWARTPENSNNSVRGLQESPFPSCDHFLHRKKLKRRQRCRKTICLLKTMTNRRTRQTTKGRNPKRAKKSTPAATPDAEMETATAETTTAPQAFVLQTMFKDAKAALWVSVGNSTCSDCLR